MDLLEDVAQQLKELRSTVLGPNTSGTTPPPPPPAGGPFLPTAGGTMTGDLILKDGGKAHSLVFDVMDYGAAGNGATDDTVAIQAAIDAAGAAGGGTVWLRPGHNSFSTNFALGSMLRMDQPHVTIASAGSFAAVLKPLAGFTDVAMIHVDANDCKLEGFGFLGGSSTTASANPATDCILIRGSVTVPTRTRITDVTGFYHNGWLVNVETVDGTYASGSATSLWLTNINSRQGGKGIHIRSGGGTRSVQGYLSGCWMDSMQLGEALFLEDAHDIDITNCQGSTALSTNASAVLRIYGDTHACYFNGTEWGANHQTGSVAISLEAFTGGGRTAEQSVPQNVFFNGFIAETANTAGVSVAAGNGVYFIGGSVALNDGTGFVVSGGTIVRLTNVQFNDNNLNVGTAYELDVQATGPQVSLYGCDFTTTAITHPVRAVASNTLTLDSCANNTGQSLYETTSPYVKPKHVAWTRGTGNYEPYIFDPADLPPDALTAGVTANATLTRGLTTVNATGGAITMTLPTAAGRPGETFTVFKVDSSANAVTINTTSSQTIDGASTVVLSAQYEMTVLVSNGANWLVIGGTGSIGGGGTGALIGSTSNIVTAPTTIDAYGAATANASWRIRSAAGTSGSPTALLSGSQLGKLSFGGYTSGGFTNGLGAVRAVATENFSATAGGTKLTFETTPNGSITPAVALTLNQDATASFAGAVTLPADPTLPLQAATKQYVDNNPAGVSLSGFAGWQDPSAEFGGALDHFAYRAYPARANLHTTINNSTTTVVVSTNRQFPSAGNYVVQIDSEQMLVTGGQGTETWTVTRGVNGTTAAAHTAGALVQTSGQRHIVGIGDSIMDEAGGGSTPGAIADIDDGLVARFRRLFATPSLGMGYAGLWNQIGDPTAEYARSGSWTAVTNGSAQDLMPFGGLTFSLSSVWMANGSTNTYTYTPREDTPLGQVDIFYLDGPTTGDWSYSLDGGTSWKTVTVASPAAWHVRKVSVIVPTEASNVMVRAANAAGTGADFWFGGMASYEQPIQFTTRGTVVHGIGYNSNTLANFCRNNPSGDDFRLLFGDDASLRPSLAIVEFSNDADAGVAGLTDFDTNLGTIISTFRSNGCDVLFIIPPEQARTATPTEQAFYRAVTSSKAVTTGCAYIDIYERWASLTGTAGVTAAISAGLMQPLVSGASVHPSQAGYEDIAAAVGRLIGMNGGPGAVHDNTFLRIDGSVNQTTGPLDFIPIRGGSTFGTPTLYLQRDAVAATANASTLGQVYFGGATDAFGTIEGAVFVRGRADALFTSTSSPGRLEFGTTPSGSVSAPAVRAGITNDGTFYVGATFAGAVATIDQTGAGTFTSLLAPTALGIALTPVQGVAGIPGFTFQRINGTLASPTKVVSGNTVADLLMGGQYDTTVGHYKTGAAISAVATQDYSSTDFGTKLLFWVADNTSSTLTTTLTLDQDLSATFAGAVTVTGATTLSSTVAISGIATFSASPVITGASGVGLNFQRDAGSAIANTNILAGIQWRGATDASHTLGNGPVIQAVATENWSGSAVGSKLIFYTVPNTTTTQTLALTLGSDQSATFAGAATFYNTAPATQTSSYDIVDIANTTAITNNAANLVTLGVNVAPVISYSTAPGALIQAWRGFYDNSTHQGTAGGASRMAGGYNSFVAAPAMKTLDTNAQTVTALSGFVSSPTLTVFAAGAMTVTTLQQFGASAITAPTGATITTLTQVNLAGPVATGTITTRKGINITDGSGAGTFTTQVGIDIAALTAAGTNIGIRNAAPQVDTPSSVQALVAGTTISPNAAAVHITSTAAITLTATPTITAGTDGQIVRIINDNTTAARTITFQSNDTLASSALSLGTTTRAVGPGGSISFQYSSAHSKWVEVGINLGGHL